MAATAGRDDPFRDEHTPQLGDAAGVPDTLAVCRDASLTLGTDSLVVLDEELQDSKGAGCCGLSLSRDNNKSTRSIPFYNILWAEHSENGDITIQYAHPESVKVVRPAIISYKLDKPDSTLVSAWIEALLARAYGHSQRQKRIKVLINPFGGQGGAVKMYHKSIAPIFAAARCSLSVEKTTHQGHGVEIAQALNINDYDLVACCSGDGIPHEVWNGLGKRPDAALALHKMAVAQLPCGSGNALSLNFNGSDSPSIAALAVVKGLRTPLDLCSVTQGTTRTLSFLSQSVGIVAETDLATEHLRWMGAARFTWGFLTRLLSQTVYPADIAVKAVHTSKTAVREAYRASAAAAPSRPHDTRPIPSPTTPLPPLQYGDINSPLPSDWSLVPHPHLGNFYAGNISYMSPDANFFPAAVPSDGFIDLVRIRGDIPRLTAIKMLLAVENNTFFDMEGVDYQKVVAYRIVPREQESGYISVDGERVPFEGFQVEVHKGLGTVMSKGGVLCEAKGV
ncbi:sphinganine kinase lcb4 [Curvularia kusanoi]|uniref:Sphinganine kinase lcb4 n=1 Tax=Curvularia kusanoi TaxID=90978 RepID=A0A9P4TH35_CURKU|nr:sphinganine kinase lcb4 [Curvularia kusanoi]